MATTSFRSELPSASPGASSRTRGAWLLWAASIGLLFVVGLPAQLYSLHIGLLLTELLAILLPALLYVRAKRVPIAAGLRLHPVPLALACRAALLGVLSWFPAAGISALVSPLIESLLGKLDPAMFAGLLPHSAATLVLWLFVGALLPGICEEVLFRGAIQGTLERKGARKAVAITAFLFAAFHMNPWNFVGPLLLGIGFGVLTIRTGSIVPSIVWHACINATAGVMAFRYGMDGGPPAWLMVVMSLVFAGLFAEFLRKTRGAVAPASPLTLAPDRPSGRAMKRLLVAAGLGCVLMVAAVFACFGVFRMSTDHLAPQIAKGDLVLVARNRLDLVKPSQGDCISFHEDGKTFLRRVTRVDEVSAWVTEQSGGDVVERRVPHRAITGKVIHTLRMDLLRSQH